MHKGPLAGGLLSAGTLAMTGWGIVLVAAMAFVLCLLILLSAAANERLCRVLAVVCCRRNQGPAPRCAGTNARNGEGPNGPMSSGT
jgi:hypothetical protein